MKLLIKKITKKIKNEIEDKFHLFFPLGRKKIEKKLYLVVLDETDNSRKEFSSRILSCANSSAALIGPILVARLIGI